MPYPCCCPNCCKDYPSTLIAYVSGVVDSYYGGCDCSAANDSFVLSCTETTTQEFCIVEDDPRLDPGINCDMANVSEWYTGCTIPISGDVTIRFAIFEDSGTHYHSLKIINNSFGYINLMKESEAQLDYPLTYTLSDLVVTSRANDCQEWAPYWRTVKCDWTDIEVVIDES